LPGKKDEKDFDDFVKDWSDLCEQKNMIMLFPVCDNDSGWVPGDSGFIVEAVRDTLGRFTVDRQRIVAHGMGIGGQMACYLGFNARDLFRGVATVGAVATNLKDNVPAQRLAFYLAGGDRDPLVKAIVDSRVKLVERKFPVFYREIPNRGREYLDDNVVRELVRWIDALDKQ
jgi:serine protease Do